MNSHDIRNTATYLTIYLIMFISLENKNSKNT